MRGLIFGLLTDIFWIHQHKVGSAQVELIRTSPSSMQRTNEPTNQWNEVLVETIVALLWQ